MNKHNRKMIFPIIIIACTILYFSFIGIVLLSADMTLPAKILSIVVSIALIGTSIFVLIERIKEIKGGEEDDLSKY